MSHDPTLDAARARASIEDLSTEQPKVRSQRRLCAHADIDGEGMHWLEPGEKCTYYDGRLPRNGSTTPDGGVS